MRASIRFVAIIFMGMVTSGLVRAEAAPDAQALAAEADAHLQVLAREGQFSGVVLIAKDGKPVFRKAYGFANLGDRVPNREDTKFNMASMGKMFTAVAVLQLAQAGKLSLDGTVGAYLPDYPNADVRDGVTIRQLLTHTSGMGNFWEEHAKRAKEQFKAVTDYLPLFASQPLAFKPGTSFAYSNSGYMVLGLIIERVTGQSYFDYVRAHIFAPAGMTDTDAYELDYVTPNLATGYTRSPDRPGAWMNNLYVNVVKGGPAGGGFSTADDMLRFANALTAFKLLDADHTRDLTAGKVPYGKRQYAYGFIEEQANGHRIIGHSGGHVGIADELMIFTDLGYTAVIFTNGDVADFWNIQTFLKKRIVGPTPDTESYDFTARAIEKATQAGYAAGLAVLKKNPGKTAIRGGLIDESGRRLLWEGRDDAAIAVLRLGVFAHPEDSQVYASLADAYARAGNRQEAAANYKRYLSMEPGDAKTADKLKKLGVH